MERSTPAPSRPRARSRGPIVAASGVALALAFTGGLLVAELAAPAVGRAALAPPPAGVEAAAAPERAPSPAWSAPAAAPAAVAAPPAIAPAIPALLTAQGRPTPALVTRVTEEATRSLEAARAGLAARCPPDRARTTPGRFTFNVVFDASGREIARGIAEDRRARAPEVAACLRALPLGALQVSPPGASVGVRVALSLP